ncbi:hypothetical protein ACXJY6_10440 [Vibrio sp. RC27]
MLRFIAVGVLVTILSGCVGHWGPTHGRGGGKPVYHDTGHHNVQKKGVRERRYR